MPTAQTETTALDLTWVRSQFPSLAQSVNGQSAVFLDGPGGTQVPQRVIDAIADYLAHSNANTCGAYATSRRTDAVIARARAAMADFLSCDKDEVAFGPNMTTLTFAISRAIGRELGPGDEILLTHLDHDANVSPWRALEERGVTIRFAEINPDDCTLNLADLTQKISSRTRVVAVGYASNAVGTINDVKEIIRLAHHKGALAYIDAVHYAPHGPIDVRALDCDFLACSTYKFFGPHMGVLYGKREHLQRLQPYKVRANTNAIPNCWEWGTLNHECIAGIAACVDYLADLGRHLDSSVTTRRAALVYELLRPFADRNAVHDLIRAYRGSVAFSLGILARTMGRVADAARHFEDALEINARMGARPWVAHTQHDHARMLLARGRAGDRQTASQLLASCLEIFRELGMERFACDAVSLASTPRARG